MGGRQRGRPRLTANFNEIIQVPPSQSRLHWNQSNVTTQLTYGASNSSGSAVLATPKEKSGSKAKKNGHQSTSTDSRAVVTASNQLVRSNVAVSSTPNSNDLLMSIKNDTAALRSEMTSVRTELKEDVNRLSQRTDGKLKSIGDSLTAAKNNIKTLFNKMHAIDSNL